MTRLQWAAWVFTVVSFFGCGAFFTWLAHSILRLRRSSHHRNNVMQQVVLMLDMLCKQHGLDTSDAPVRAKALTDSGDAL